MTTQPHLTNRLVERLLARLRRKNKEIAALQAGIMSREVELDASAREIEALETELLRRRMDNVSLESELVQMTINSRISANMLCSSIDVVTNWEDRVLRH